MTPVFLPFQRTAARFFTSAAVLFCLGVATARAGAPVAVDTELVLLVDVSGGVTDPQFSSLIEGYARAMTSTSVIDAIETGRFGKIATSLVFWGGENNQQTVVPWMEISDAGQAADFSTLVRAATRPFKGKTAIGSAINHAVPLFGTETGGAQNGFSSIVQVIDVSGGSVDNSTPPRGDRAANVRAARDGALASGVDMINGLAITNTNANLASYYAANVIGGSVGDAPSFVQEAEGYTDVEQALEQALVLKLSREIFAGSEQARAVPEPSTLFLMAPALVLMWKRRKTPSLS